jgi:amidase
MARGVSGWSAVGGMCEPAYIPAGYQIGEKPRGKSVGNIEAVHSKTSLNTLVQTPAGSSTGSAVGVACEFAPVALGTETSGSLVSPSAVAALYALKLTQGSVPLDGIMEVTACFDTVGAMGKSALNVALTCDALSPKRNAPGLASIASSVNLSDVSVGFVDIEKWSLPKHTQVNDPKYYGQTVRPARCN